MFFFFFDLVWKESVSKLFGVFSSFRIKFLSGANDLQLKLSSRPDTGFSRTRYENAKEKK